MIVTLKLLGKLMVNVWLILFAKVIILQLLLMIHLVVNNTSLFYVTTPYLHVKRISKMGGAMIGRLEIGCFKAIGTIREEELSNFCVVGYLPICILLLSFGVLCQVCHALGNPQMQRFPSNLYFGMQGKGNNFARIS
jgi:hypothetical protein